MAIGMCIYVYVTVVCYVFIEKHQVVDVVMSVDGPNAKSLTSLSNLKLCVPAGDG